MRSELEAKPVTSDLRAKEVGALPYVMKPAQLAVLLQKAATSCSLMMLMPLMTTGGVRKSP
jgi:hypothetical protein